MLLLLQAAPPFAAQGRNECCSNRVSFPLAPMYLYTFRFKFGIVERRMYICPRMWKEEKFSWLLHLIMCD